MSIVVSIAIDGESFCQNGRTVDVHVEFWEIGVRGVDLAR